MPRQRRKAAYCLNCQTSLKAEDNFCPVCGQENDDKRKTMRHFLWDAWLEIVQFDGIFWRTLPPLLWQPGRLTQAYLQGKRKKYVPPVRLLFVTAFLYLLVANVLINYYVPDNRRLAGQIIKTNLPDSTRQRIDTLKKFKLWEQRGSGYSLSLNNLGLAKVQMLAEKGITDEKVILDSLQVEHGFWNTLTVRQIVRLGAATPAQIVSKMVERLPYAMFFILPVFALMLKAMYFRRKFYYLDHFVFALHLHSFYFVGFGAITLLIGFGTEGGFSESVYSVIFLLMMIYTAVAMKRVYAQAWWKTLVKYTVLGFAYSFVITIMLALGALISLITY